MITDNARCVVCGSNAWIPLPNLGPRSVTTSGRIIDQSLGKAQCELCGLVQRVEQPYLSNTDYYEKRYSFYERPGAEQFDHARYKEMAAWIASAIPSPPRRVLDAGCGRGWMMEALRDVFPDAHFSGIEPSEQESENARRRGLRVTTSRIGAHTCTSGPRYDLVYSTNVLEHTASPVDFLRGLTDLVTPTGQVMILCPDGTQPGAELLFADQNFSFLPAHFLDLAASIGMDVIRWRPPPPMRISLRDKQVVTLAHVGDDRGCRCVVPSQPPVCGLHQARVDYVGAWCSLDQILCCAIDGASTVYHFGTSTWSFLIAAYCPQYWSTVAACIIDGGGGDFFGKPVRDAGTTSLVKSDVVVLGVDPEKQRRLAERIRVAGGRPVRWDTVITR